MCDVKRSSQSSHSTDVLILTSVLIHGLNINTNRKLDSASIIMPKKENVYSCMFQPAAELALVQTGFLRRTDGLRHLIGPMAWSNQPTNQTKGQ